MVRVLRALGLSLGVAVVAATPTWSKNPPPPGVIAASAGDSVVLADPRGTSSRSIAAGTVGWLFPAPAGVLFAPDLVHGRTTVIDVTGGRVEERFDGVTMPHFGDLPDRYLVVAGDVLVVSYPERALIARVPAGIDHPWQVLPVSVNILLVLERDPARPGETRLVAVDMINRQVVFRRALPPGVAHIAASAELGVLAVADSDSRAIELYAPSTMELIESLPVPGSPRDVAFLGDGRTLVAATAPAPGVGQVARWMLKVGHHGLKVKEESGAPLSSAPVRMAVAPAAQPLVAVGLEASAIEVVNLAEGRREALIELPAIPRDVVWCDPTVPGPTLPEWSDEQPPELDIRR